MSKQSFVNVNPVFNKDKYVAPVPVNKESLLAETPLIAASIRFAETEGGRHTKEIIRQIREHYEHPIRRATDAGLVPTVDVRIHRLTNAQYPEQPGWHCSGVPRGGYTGQPTFEACNAHAFHVALTLSSQPVGVSSTEFVMAAIRPQLYDEEHIYKNLHQEVQRMRPSTAKAPDGVFTWFNQRSIHRASPCHMRGVRFYLRFSMVEKPVVANIVPTQEQVYILTEENGW